MPDYMKVLFGPLRHCSSDFFVHISSYVSQLRARGFQNAPGVLHAYFESAKIST